MEKYLQKTDVSGSSDASVAHTTFDLTAWADNLISSQRNHQAGYPEEPASSALEVDSETQQKSTSTKIEEKDRREETTLNTNLTVSLSNALSPGHKSDSKRSSIPRPCTFARRSVGACDNSASSATKTRGSSGRTLTENVVKVGESKPRASNSIRSSLETSQRSDKSSTASSDLPRTPPGSRKGQSGLSCFKGSSPPAQNVRSAGQQQQDRPYNSPEKKPLLRSIMAAPLPCSSVEKHVGFSQPPLDSASGE